MSIRRKFIVFVSLSVIVILCTAFISGYFYFYLPRLESTGSTQAQVAQQLAYTLGEIIDEKIRDFPLVLGLGWYEDVLAVANSRYKDLNSQEIVAQMLEIDRKWQSNVTDGSWRQYLNKGISVDLEQLQKQENYLISELILTDAHGGLVAVSGKTSDYYQADEEWWQKASRGARGNVYVGEAEYDESSGVFAIPVAFALRDARQNVMGVCKVVVGINAFFDILVNYSKQEGLHATLLNSRNEVLFHPDMAPLERMMPEFEKMQKSGSKWMIVDHSSFHEGRGGMFLAYADIMHPWFVANNLHWKVIVAQEKRAILWPLYLFLLRLAAIETVMLVVLIVLAFVFGTMSFRPLEKLSRGTEYVASGDLEYRVNIHTGDEIERLANSFNKMTEALRRTNAKRMRAEEELKKALEVKSEFTSTVSHELKTPLAAIREGVQLVVDGSLGPVNAEQKDCLQIVKGNIERLVRLITDILDFQRLESGRMAFHIKTNDLHVVIREVTQTMSFSAQKKGLDLFLKLDKRPVLFSFDKDKIAQVLSNIFSNAIKFTDKGAITLSTVFEEGYVLVSVEDTGVGIRREDIPKLFQRFSQINDHGYRKTGGTGLGLVISREIIKQHNGEIWVEPAAGKGAIIRFRLPLRDAGRSSA
ncbi:MAG: sensor histidine kinase [Candidatus Omnitrophica bacterium]|nr:sensor histidine kinase [Candidatus Omnitrophota bacterium]